MLGVCGFGWPLASRLLPGKSGEPLETDSDDWPCLGEDE